MDMSAITLLMEQLLCSWGGERTRADFDFLQSVSVDLRK
jgi:hypothetical protein